MLLACLWVGSGNLYAQTEAQPKWVPLEMANLQLNFTDKWKIEMQEHFGIHATSPDGKVQFFAYVTDDHSIDDAVKSMQKDLGGKLLFASDPDYCCYLNKTQPLEPVLAAHDIWINGVRGDQSDVRKRFRVEEPAPFDTIRFHPMLDWSPKMIYAYRKEYNIPHHPMEDKGYFSIGCEPCTRKLDMETGSREGRWFGLKKTECGLNTDLVGKG